MIELNDAEKAVVRKIFDTLYAMPRDKVCGFLRGEYDATNGSIDFILGIETMTNYLCSLAGDDDYCDQIDQKFRQNILDSQKNAEDDDDE